MALKDLMVHVGGSPASASTVEVAARLAAWHDAHLTGVHVRSFRPLSGWMDPEAARLVYEAEARRMDDEADRARQLFDRTARGAGLTLVEWRAVDAGLVIEALRLHARYADLTVVGQGRDVEPDLRSLPEDLVLAAGRPVLVVPRYGDFPTIGERVLVAWNGAPEAARAVNDALPLLRRAQTVTVLSIDPEDAERRIPSADITLHLVRHGVKAVAAQTRGADLAVGDVLLSYAADLGADLIVAGAYGHTRLRELVLGGMTRHLLKTMTVPVFMSH
jgi:nucleotide-binding universal stress UspA family protein